MSNQKPKVRRRRAGPKYQGIGLAESRDGLSFQNLNKFLTEYGGVPCIITIPNGTVFAAFQYFNPRSEAFTLLDGSIITANYSGMATSKSIDNGKTWNTPEKIKLKNLPKPLDRPVDPVITYLDDGRYRLFFCYPPPNTPNANSKVLSAISEDCINFTVEKGVRFMIEGKIANDPVITKIKGRWHYYSPIFSPDPWNNEHGNYHAVSEDGLNFKREPDIVGEGLRFLGNVCVADKGYRFYTTYNGVSSAFSKDGYEWVVEPGVRLGGSNVAGDAGVTKLIDGKYLMAYTTRTLRQDPFDRL